MGEGGGRSVGNKVRRGEANVWCKGKRDEHTPEALVPGVRRWNRERERGKGEQRERERRRVRRGGGGETRLPRMLRDCIATWECNDCTGARLAPTCTHVHTRRSWECADPYQHGKRSLTSLCRPLMPPHPLASHLPPQHLRHTTKEGCCEGVAREMSQLVISCRFHDICVVLGFHGVWPTGGGW